MQYRRLAVIGIGLIGGSFALAAKQRNLVERVVGVARSEATLQQALQCGVADEVTSDLSAAVVGADLIYLAAPVRATEKILTTLAPLVSPDTLVTDAGSTKERVVNWATEILTGRCQFLGGHPMAGSDQAGPSAARADLFEGKTYILTPTPDTPYTVIEQFREFVTQLGAVPLLAEAGQHDRIVAATSHLPHLVAAALCGALSDLAGRTGDLLPFTGTGLRDTTRIAKGPSEVWRDILIENRDYVRAALVMFSEEIDRYLIAMSEGDEKMLENLLSGAREFRKGLDR